MAETYGKTPAEIMHAEHMAPIERFQFNSDVLQATSQFKEQVRERKRAAQEGVGSREERKDMIQDQIDRGTEEQNPPSEQVDALDDVLAQRAAHDDGDEPHPDSESGGDPSMHSLVDAAGGPEDGQ